MLTKLAHNGESNVKDNTSSSVMGSAMQDTITPLGEACIHAARDSYSLMVNQWIEGRFPVFSYTHAHGLFSAALVLAMASLVFEHGHHTDNASERNNVGSRIDTDKGGLRVSIDILRTMSEHGSPPATEYLKNLESVQSCLDSYHSRADINRNQQATGIEPNLPSTIATTLSAITAAAERLQSLTSSTQRVPGETISRPYTITERPLPSQTPTGMTSHQMAFQGLPQSDVNTDVPFYSQQQSEINEYDNIGDVFFNWDMTGPLWAE